MVTQFTPYGYSLNSLTRKLRCCRAQLEQLSLFCAIFATEHNFGRFRAVLAVIIFHFGEIWGQIGYLSRRNLSFPKFVAVCPKNATSCLHMYFHSRSHWDRVARLMTFQRSLQYGTAYRCREQRLCFHRYLTLALH